MPYNILSRLSAEGLLESCSIIVFHKGAIGDRKTIFGRDISKLTRSRIEHIGGESGYERLSAPIDSVIDIEANSATIFRRKMRIKRIYPRA